MVLGACEVYNKDTSPLIIVFISWEVNTLFSGLNRSPHDVYLYLEGGSSE